LSGAESKSTGGVVAAVFLQSEEEISVAFSDPQSGRIRVREGIALRGLRGELSRVHPTEVILPEKFLDMKLSRRVKWVRELERLLDGAYLKFRVADAFGTSAAHRDLSTLPGYSAASETGKRAIRLLVSYIDETTVDGRV